jgi:hypothetical protein
LPAENTSVVATAGLVAAVPDAMPVPVTLTVTVPKPAAADVAGVLTTATAVVTTAEVHVVPEQAMVAPAATSLGLVRK